MKEKTFEMETIEIDLNDYKDGQTKFVALLNEDPKLKSIHERMLELLAEMGKKKKDKGD